MPISTVLGVSSGESGGDVIESEAPASNAAIFEPGPEMPVARMGHHVVTLPDGRAAMFGGHGQGFTSLSSAQFWVPGENAMSAQQMNHSHDTAIFVRLADDRYLLAGGSSDYGVPAYAYSEIYDPVAGAFSSSGDMVRFRSNSSGVALKDGRVLMAGAWWVHNDAHTYGELFDPVSGTYEAVGPFGVARSHAIVLPMNDGSAVILGGRQAQGSFQDMPVERYVPGEDEISEWQTLLFPGESGWEVSFGNRLVDAQKMADGRFLWLATRNASNVTQYRLFTFDPSDGSIDLLPLAESLPDSSSGAFMQVLVDAARSRAHLLALVPQVSGHPALEVLSIDTDSGAMTRSSNSYLPGYSIGGAGLQVLPDGRILVSGGSSDGSNFNPVNQTLLITPPAVDTSCWYDAASTLADGWRYFDWFKGFKPEASKWIYHGRHGWLYVIAEDTGGMFLLDAAMKRWLWTNETIYPWIYAYGPGEGWVFFFEGGRPGTRFFQRGDNGQVVSEQALRID